MIDRENFKGVKCVLSFLLIFILLFALTIPALTANEDYTPTITGVVSDDRSTLTITAVFPDISGYTVSPVNAYVGFYIEFEDGCEGTLDYANDWFAQFYVQQSDGTLAENNPQGSGNAGVVVMYSTMPSITFTLHNAPSSGTVATIAPAKAGYGPSSGRGQPPTEDYYSYILTGRLGNGTLDSYWTSATVSGDGLELAGGSSVVAVPASDITNSAGATVTSAIANGTATLNVTADKACVVAYTTDGGTTYTRVNATANASGGYDFSVSDYSDSMKFVVAVKGDVSGDGDIDSDDFGPLVAAFLETGELSGLGRAVGDLDGNGVIDSDDFGPLVAAFLGTGEITW